MFGWVIWIVFWSSCRAAGSIIARRSQHDEVHFLVVWVGRVEGTRVKEKGRSRWVHFAEFEN